MTYVRSFEPEKKLDDFNVFFLTALYLQGLSYIVVSMQILRERKSLFKKNRRVPITPPTYEEIVKTYDLSIGYPPPDRAVFEAADQLYAEVGAELRGS